jgi:pSer/pThr/pTyr-binding forkhead associated (FHA) protein
MAKIIVKLKDKTLHEIILSPDTVTTIGRDPSNSIHLVNPAVSRFHARICSEAGEFYIEDTGSSNGTFVNGKMVPLTSELSNKDKITIGKYTLIFVDQSLDYEDVKTDKSDETVFVRKTESPEKSGAQTKPPVCNQEASQKEGRREFAGKYKMLFLAVLMLIGIALLFFFLGSDR